MTVDVLPIWKELETTMNTMLAKHGYRLAKASVKSNKKQEINFVLQAIPVLNSENIKKM